MIGAIVLDSGWSRSVCGLAWCYCYLDILPEKVKKQKQKVEDSKSTFRLGNNHNLKSVFKVKLPWKLAGKRFIYPWITCCYNFEG